MEKSKHPLETAKFGVIPRINYRGVYITKQPNGLFSLWKYKDLTPEQVDAKMEETYRWLNKSIKE